MLSVSCLIALGPFFGFPARLAVSLIAFFARLLRIALLSVVSSYSSQGIHKAHREGVLHVTRCEMSLRKLTCHAGASWK